MYLKQERRMNIYDLGALSRPCTDVSHFYLGLLIGLCQLQTVVLMT
jgi:hypothetical protein